LQGLLESFDEFVQWNTHGVTDLADFQQVQSPFTRFVLADERLRLAELYGQVALAQTGA